MQRRILDILACPFDRHHPLGLVEFRADGDSIVDGFLACPECERYFPIIDEVPTLLPDEMRNKKADLEFLAKWGSSVPEKVARGGKPWSLQEPPTSLQSNGTHSITPP
jgi:uncharacterized protein